MKLSEKQKNLLDKCCINRLGITFDNLYNAIKLEEEKKEKEKQIKKAKREKSLC